MGQYKQDIKALVSSGLLDLREEFRCHGFDLRLVGGVVRDLVRGVKANDIDLCTDATPDEQRLVYESMKKKPFSSFDFIPTGEQHGTFTVIPHRGGEGYEITSLRTESEHDGRHAVMTYTRDWTEDLSRRDFTINAMALTFDGELIDPFGGKSDLANHVVRFVGDARERMREDYLRILRYFRFLGRISEMEMTVEQIDADVRDAILECLPGLQRISVERVWSEVHKMLKDPHSRWVYPLMIQMGVHEHTPLPSGDEWAMHKYQMFKYKDAPVYSPEVLMCSFFTSIDHADQVARALKWSTESREIAKHIMSYEGVATYEDIMYEVMVKGKPAKYGAAAAAFFGIKKALNIDTKDLPVFPAIGERLKEAGIMPGARMGKIISVLKDRWFHSGARMSVDEMIEVAIEMQ